MKQLFPRGKRIRPTDKDLVFHTALASLLPVFLLVVLLFHIRQIAGTDWQEVSLSQIVQDVNIPYLLFSMGVAGLVCLTAVPGSQPPACRDGRAPARRCSAGFRRGRKDLRAQRQRCERRRQRRRRRGR